METEATGGAGPLPLDWDQLDCRAEFDYIKVWHPKRSLLPAMTGTKNWNKLAYGQPGYSFTMQDPIREDIEILVEHLGNPTLAGIQLRVDLKPKRSVPESTREALLVGTFNAMAGRFRPEIEALWGYGTRGAVNGKGQTPRPFHRRFPRSDEFLVYGQRDNRAQSTAYLKRTNEGVPLDPVDHCVRMELTLWRAGLMEVGLNALNELLGYPYQRDFRKHFRIVGNPRVRAVRSRSAAELRKLEQKMWRGWATAGVGKFAISPELPDDTLSMNMRRIVARSKQQLPASDYVLTSDRLSTEKIGSAFKQLGRRLKV